MIKVVNLILFKFAFSGNIINGYWIKTYGLKTATYLEHHLFCQKNKDKDVILENYLASLRNIRCANNEVFH